MATGFPVIKYRMCKNCTKNCEFLIKQISQFERRSTFVAFSLKSPKHVLVLGAFA
jgi:hypothetical protein